MRNHHLDLVSPDRATPPWASPALPATTPMMSSGWRHYTILLALLIAVGQIQAADQPASQPDIDAATAAVSAAVQSVNQRSDVAAKTMSDAAAAVAAAPAAPADPAARQAAAQQAAKLCRGAAAACTDLAQACADHADALTRDALLRYPHGGGAVRGTGLVSLLTEAEVARIDQIASLPPSDDPEVQAERKHMLADIAAGGVARQEADAAFQAIRPKGLPTGGSLTYAEARQRVTAALYSKALFARYAEHWTQLASDITTSIVTATPTLPTLPPGLKDALATAFPGTSAASTATVPRDKIDAAVRELEQRTK